MEYLDFEQPIQELEEQLQKCAVIGDESDVDDSGGLSIALNVVEVTVLVRSHDRELVLVLTTWTKHLCLVTGVLESEANLLFA